MAARRGRRRWTAARREQADRRHAVAVQRRWRGGRSHPAEARRREDRSDGLVVGHSDHGPVHRARITTRSTASCSTRRNGSFTGAAAAIGGSGKLGAYRTVSREAAKAALAERRARGQEGRPHPARLVRAWADATFATDPAARKQTPPVLRAPNGVVRGLPRLLGRRKAALRSGRYPRADLPRACRVGRRSAELSGARYFAKLTNAPYKRYVRSAKARTR